MAYGLFLYKEFKSVSNKTIRLEIFQKDYAGASMEIVAMGKAPVVLTIDNMNNEVQIPIIKSYLNINIKDTAQFDYSIFFTPDATKFKVVIKINSVDEWAGYLTPDSFIQNLEYRGEINLIARDNIGMLAEYDYDNTLTFTTIQNLITTAISKISFLSTLEFKAKKIDENSTNILSGLLRNDIFAGKSWLEALEITLKGIGCQMRFIGLNKYAIFDIGDINGYGDTATTQDFLFIEKSGVSEIVPAWKTIKVLQDYILTENFYDGYVEADEYSFLDNRGGDLENPYNFYVRPYYTIPISNDWVSTFAMLSPYDYPNLNPNDLFITGTESDSPLVLSSYLTYGKYITGLTDGTMIRISFKANNYPHFISQRRGGEYILNPMLRKHCTYIMKVRCNVFYQTATTKYVLQGQRWIEWTAGFSDSLEFNLPETQASYISGKQGGTMTSNMDNPIDQDIDISVYGLGEDGKIYIEFYPYTATYTIVDSDNDDYPPIVFSNHLMKLSEFSFSVVANLAASREAMAVINENHNINGEVELNVGEIPVGLGGYLNYNGGIYENVLNYYPPMTGFHRPSGVTYHLSELIGREVAHHYKTQRKKISGTIINSENRAAMPHFGKAFTDGTLNYALNYGSLDLQNEVMQVELIEVEPYTTEDYTFIEAEVDTGGGQSLGSGTTEFIQWSAAGNAKRIYDLDTASEADQGGAFVFIDKSGLTAAKKVPISSLLVDAYTKTESDSRFASIDGDLTQDFSAKKLTTATLLLPQSSPTLSSGEVAIYSLDSGFSGETPSGAGTLTSVALTMPTGFSVSGSPITESGTFGVTFASGYRMFTETEIGNKIESSLIGAANGITPLDSGGKVALQYLPSTLLKYMGVWNASTNSPTLTSPDTNRKGQVWNVSIAGTQFGLDFKLGDWLIYNDSGVAEKSDNSDDVTSVNGYTGAVTLKTSDIAEQTNLYYTDARVKTYADTLYTPIAHASATNNPHAVTAAQVGAIANQSSSAQSANLWITGVVRADSSFRFGTAATMFMGVGGTITGVLGLSDYLLFNTGGDMYLWTTGGYGLKIAATTGAATFSSSVSGTRGIFTTLLIPQSAPTLASGEMAIYGLESGFSGETPSGAGSVTSISMVVPTGLSVTPETITESGTFTISYASGYSIPTNTKQSEWDNAYTLRHNAVTLGTANGLSLSTQELSLGLASTSANGALSSTDWNTFNGKQAKLIGTGVSSLVRVNTSGVIAYDDSTYLTGNQTITLSGIITGSGTTAITTAIADGALSIAKTSGLQTALDGKLSTTGKAADSDKLDGQDSTYFQVALTNPVTGTGTSGYIPKFTGASTIGNSSLSDDGTDIVLNRATRNAIRYANDYGAPTNSGTNSNGDKLILGNFGATEYRIGLGEAGEIWYQSSYGHRFLTGANTSSIGVEALVLSSTGVATFVNSVQMLENINTNLRIPKVAPTSPTSGQYYFYIVE